ncbi:hypothetical protein D3C72_1578560 [compost metagenome]
MKAKKRVFVNHVVSTVRNQLRTKGDIIAEVEFSEEKFQEILMYISLIKEKAQRYNIEISEDVIPNSLLVFSKKAAMKGSTKTTNQIISNVLAVVK